MDLEAHFYSLSYSGHLRARPRAPVGDSICVYQICVYQEPSAPEVWQLRGRRVEDALLDRGATRLAARDAAGVDVQVLALAPPSCEQFESGEGARQAAVGGNAVRLLGL